MRVTAIVASDVYGGGEEYLLSLRRQLATEGVALNLIGRLPGAKPSDVLAVDVGPKWSRRSAWTACRRSRVERNAFLHVVRSARPPDVFLLQYKREQVLLTTQLARAAPVVWTEHGKIPAPFTRWPLRRLYAQAARDTARIIAVSEAVASEVTAVTGLPGSHVCVIPNAVDPTVFHPNRSAGIAHREQWGMNNARVVLTLSRLDRQKGIDRVLDAISELDPRYALVIAGAGPAEDDLRRRAAHLGDRVRFLGFVNGPAGVLAAADMMVLASREREGLPLAVLQAVTCGTPVVLTEDSGMGDWGRQHGQVVVSSSVSDLAAGIERTWREREHLRAAALAAGDEHEGGLWSRRHAALLRDVAGRRS